VMVASDPPPRNDDSSRETVALASDLPGLGVRFA
jgi:hypothetical protein